MASTLVEKSINIIMNIKSRLKIGRQVDKLAKSLYVPRVILRSTNWLEIVAASESIPNSPRKTEGLVE